MSSSRELGTVNATVLASYDGTPDPVKLSSDLAYVAPLKDTAAASGSTMSSSAVWADGEMARVATATYYGGVGLFRGHSTLASHPILGPGRFRVLYTIGGNATGPIATMSKSGYPNITRSGHKTATNEFHIGTNAEVMASGINPVNWSLPSNTLLLEYNGIPAPLGGNCFGVHFDTTTDELVIGNPGTYLVSLLVTSYSTSPSTYSGPMLAELRNAATGSVIAKADCVNPGEAVRECTTVVADLAKGARLALYFQVPVQPLTTESMAFMVEVTRVAPA